MNMHTTLHMYEHERWSRAARHWLRFTSTGEWAELVYFAQSYTHAGVYAQSQTW